VQLISPEDARDRQDYYDENQIGWVARPKHNPNPSDGETVFLRRGKFKKASNMNYAMRLSVRVEELLTTVVRHSGWTQTDENNAYREAMQSVLEERQGEAWADGNIRMGDYILIIDSDTRVPNDCFLEAVSEMEYSPQVAILQYASGVMNVTNSFFENGITFFTNLIYTMIRFAVANGDVAPFVGHNAILRWSALQDIGYECEHDGWEKYWSENTVSEDFDMALRLQAEGYIVRLGAYKNGGYQEGVSLTVYDELARWEK
jgi:membrane glycosyltransferase